MKYLLDTNVLSDIVRSNPNVRARLCSSKRTELAVSVVTLKEIEYGRRRRPSGGSRIDAAMDDLLRDLQEIPFKREEALVTGRLRAFLDGVGTPIGHFDVMIAGTALTHGLTMVTANLGEFSRVPNLNIENWRDPFRVREERLAYGYGGWKELGESAF